METMRSYPYAGLDREPMLCTEDCEDDWRFSKHVWLTFNLLYCKYCILLYQNVLKLSITFMALMLGKPRNYCVLLFAGLLVSMHPEGPATGHLDTGFLGFHLSSSKCWDGSQVPTHSCMFLMQPSPLSINQSYPLPVEATELLNFANYLFFIC
jgi:hypothetical protein